MKSEVKHILEAVRDGDMSIDDALLKLKTKPYEDIGFAKTDLHRKVQQGIPEVIYGAGKTARQIIGIMNTMKENGQERILITRLSKEAAEIIGNSHELSYYETARIGFSGDFPAPDGIGNIVVATGGTSDIPVAEEAAVTAELCGANVNRIYDIGVSGIHRLIDALPDIRKSNAVVAVAGMEGALASVLAGQIDKPVIAVPTSIGYGANLQGISALLTMINSCATGMATVNIDNGFGGGYMAAQINRLIVNAAQNQI